MSRRSFGSVFASVVACLALGAGCGSADQGTMENKIHATKNFSSAELNAPLSAQARAKGAQVPPPPTR